jgi:NAD(P)-dependent dehydrogenase (short-subunit alcohol dehydrogenase family)
MMAGFEEKVVVVTGSSGIGLGAALHLASEGAKVYVCGIDGPTNDTARQKASGLNLTVFRVDVSDPDQVQEWMEGIGNSNDGIDCLISRLLTNGHFP